MEVKVSIIIPVYGVELFLERAVDSALGQTLAEKEIILVDDGSPDACPEICERYAREYPGLVRVFHQENQGLGMARNAGAALAQGEYLLFLDSDDTIQPEMAQALYEKAKGRGLRFGDVRRAHPLRGGKPGGGGGLLSPGGGGPGGLHRPRQQHHLQREQAVPPLYLAGEPL